MPRRDRAPCRSVTMRPEPALEPALERPPVCMLPDPAGPGADRRQQKGDVMARLVLRLKQVLAPTGLSRSTIFVLQQQGIFPQSIKLGSKATGWYEDEVQEYIQTGPAGAARAVALRRRRGGRRINRAHGRRAAPGGLMAPGPNTYRPVWVTNSNVACRVVDDDAGTLTRRGTELADSFLQHRATPDRTSLVRAIDGEDITFPEAVLGRQGSGGASRGASPREQRLLADGVR